MPGPETVKGPTSEVEECYERVRKIRLRMTCAQRGSDPYQNLLSQRWIELVWLKTKAELAAEAIGEYHESLLECE